MTTVFGSVLVPIDVAHPSSWEEALPKAIELVRPHNGAVIVMTVVRELQAMLEGTFVPIQVQQMVVAAESRLAHIVAGYPQAKNVRTEVRVGSVPREIVAAAERHNVDLIMMTSHRPEMRDYLIGPNAAGVARHARCSVLILRQRP